MLLRLVVLNKVSIFRISFLLTLDIPISLIFFCVYLRFFICGYLREIFFIFYY